MLHLSARKARTASQVYGRIVWTTSHGLSTPPPPPPINEQKSSESGPRKSKVKSRLFFALVGATAVTSATLAYAKSDQEFRDILKDYAPWTDEAIAIIYEEKETPVSQAISTVRGWATTASDTIFGTTPEPPPPPMPKKVETLKPIPKIAHTPAPLAVPKPPEPVIVEKVDVIPKIEKFDSPEAAAAMEAAHNAALNAYKRATEALKVYSKKIDRVIEDSSEEISKNILDDLRQATNNLTDAENSVRQANKKLEEALGGSTSSNADRIRKSIQTAEEDHNRASANASVSRRYWSQVEQARKYFIEELQAIYPDVDISAQKLNMRGGNPDALLLVALRRILLYQQMLARQDTILSQNVTNAIKGSEEDVIRAKVEMELEKERRNLSISYQKKEAAVRAKAYRELDTQMKRQLDIHTSHLQDTLDKHAEKVREDERKTADEKAEAQKVAQELRLAAVLGRLQGVDDALKARSDADKMARQSQKLWAACEALESALRRDSTAPMSLSKELDAISAAAADSDELVVAVLRGVPNLARERGVFGELALRERFTKVEKACKKVALVPEEGGSLPIYFLSWLQSIFLISGQGIPKDELNDEPVDFSKLDTNEILQRVRYWVERCDWTQALRYVNLLRGAPGSVAQDWANEVTLHLETKQAARALLAHASATGLLHL